MNPEPGTPEHAAAEHDPAAPNPAAPNPAAPNPPAPDHGTSAPDASESLTAPDSGPEHGLADSPLALHSSLAPLRFLIGRWEGAGVVGYPTIESAQFGQEILFSHNGKPYLIYSSRSWLLDDDGRIGRPLAVETGFWRAQDDGMLEVVLAHASGITEIYLGQVSGTKIEMATDAVVRTATAKEVTAGKRLYGLIGADLGYAYDMAAVGQPLQAHLSAQLKRTA
jgi:THAP4-like, heme-binding beta-barrel domain